MLLLKLLKNLTKFTENVKKVVVKMLEDAKVYSEDEFYENFLNFYRGDSAMKLSLEPVPENLSYDWVHTFTYLVHEMYNSALISSVVTATFNEKDSFENWASDYLGFIWVENDEGGIEDDEAYYADPMNREAMQNWLDISLQRYKSLFDRLVDAGVKVES